MARSLNKKYFGNRNIGSASTAADDGIGGEGVDSIPLGGANNSSGFTAGLTQISINAPDIPTGVQAVASLVVGPAGAFLTQAAGTSGTDRSTFSTFTGTGVTAAGTFTGLTQKSTNGTGSGATFSVVKTGGTAYSATISVVATSKGTGYIVGNTITIDGASLGGVTSTNDLTFTIAGAVAAAGTITGITITEQGSGYTGAPSMTLATGNLGTLTLTAVLTVDTGAVGSVTNEENAILPRVYIPGGTNFYTGDIIKQVSGRRFKVQNSEGTGICQLKTSSFTLAAGEMTIKATDSEGKNYLVAKITNRRVTLVPNAAGGTIGTQFASGTTAKWTFGSAVLNDTVTIQNG